MIRKDISVAEGEIKAIDAESQPGGFAGYAAVFSVIDRVYDSIEPGAFADSLQSFAENAIVLFNHDSNLPIGQVRTIIEDSIGLYCECEFSATETAQRVRQLIAEGTIKKLSVQFRIKRAERWSEDELKLRLGRTWNEMTADERNIALLYGRKILEAELLEISPVSIPANTKTRIVQVKSHNELQEREEVEQRTHQAEAEQRTHQAEIEQVLRDAEITLILSEIETVEVNENECCYA